MSTEEKIEKILFTGLVTRKGVKEIRRELIEEVIKPLCKDAFEAGAEYMRSEYEHLENRGTKAEPDFEEWLTKNLS